LEEAFIIPYENTNNRCYLRFKYKNADS